MSSMLDALIGAFRSLFSLRMLWLMVWPVLAAVVMWAVLAFAFWSPLQSAWMWLYEYFGIAQWMTGIEPAWIGAALQVLLHLMLFVPLVMLTALVLTAIFGMDAMVKTVSEGFFPQLEKRRGGSVIGSAANAFIAVVVYVGLWVVTLPLWLLGPVGAVIPLVTAGYLNQRLFRYDALAIHADADELKAVIEENRGSLWALGILLGLVQFVPLLNFFAPVFTGLAFIHYCLGRLGAHRART
ncbi:MAG: EI24 domain-containing protein [Pseudomonadota bacterium]